MKNSCHIWRLKDNVERFLKQKADNTARLAEKIQKKKD
jgi:hypothetical protein